MTCAPRSGSGFEHFAAIQPPLISEIQALLPGGARKTTYSAQFLVATPDRPA